MKDLTTKAADNIRILAASMVEKASRVIPAERWAEPIS